MLSTYFSFQSLYKSPASPHTIASCVLLFPYLKGKREWTLFEDHKSFPTEISHDRADVNLPSILSAGLGRIRIMACHQGWYHLGLAFLHANSGHKHNISSQFHLGFIGATHNPDPILGVFFQVDRSKIITGLFNEPCQKDINGCSGCLAPHSTKCSKHEDYSWNKILSWTKSELVFMLPNYSRLS